MRNIILGIAAAVAASPVLADGLPLPEERTYQRENYTYDREYRQAPPPTVYYRPAPRVIEVVPAPTVVIRRPVVVARPPVVIDYPVYAAPEVYAHSYPVRRYGPWGHRRHFYRGF
jgi:hypothetical protein